MWKFVLAAAGALAIAGSSLVYAQQPPAAPADGGPRGRMTAQDAQAFTDAHVAALKAGLQLTPDQQKNWPPVETAIRDLAKQRQDRMAQRRELMREARNEPGQRDGIALLRRQADAMTERANGLKRLADAAEPLYKTLDDGQKRRLAVLAWSMRPRADHGRRGERPG